MKRDSLEIIIRHLDLVTYGWAEKYHPSELDVLFRCSATKHSFETATKYIMKRFFDFSTDHEILENVRMFERM